MKKERGRLFKSYTFWKNGKPLPQSPSMPGNAEKNNPTLCKTRPRLRLEFFSHLKVLSFGTLHVVAPFLSPWLSGLKLLSGVCVGTAGQATSHHHHFCCRGWGWGCGESMSWLCGFPCSPTVSALAHKKGE